MLYFASVNFLWLLLLVPLFPLCYALSLRWRKKRIQRLGDAQLVERLMPSYSRARGWWKVALFSLGFAFFVVGLSRPLIGAKLKEHETKGVEVVIALDVSNSMLAQDYSPNRLERAKLAISRIVDKLRDDRIGLIVFAGSSYVQLPITTDYVSAKMFLNSISTESVPIQGTALGDAINTAARSFSAQSEKSRAIIVITDGENHEDDPVKAAKAAAEMGVRVFTIGVGSPEGKPIPLKEGGLMKDRNGEIVVTHLDEEILREVASAGNGAYVRAGNTEFGLNPIIDSIKQMDEEKFNSVVFEEFDEQYMYFFAIALFFFVLEGLIGSRKTRLRLFGTGGGGAGKAAMALALLLSVSFGAFAQTDRKDVRRGNRDYRKENWKEAEIDYRKALVKDSLSTAANYNLAADLYRQGDYDGALAAMKKVEAQAVESGHGADYYYNLGDIALAKKDYKTAVDAFQKSLLSRPEDLDAKENYVYARKMLEDQQQNGGGGGSNDQNQDQNNQDQNNQDKNQNNQDKNDQNKDQNKANQNQNDQNKDNQDQNQNGNDDQNKDQQQNRDQQNQNGDQPQDSQGQPQEQKISPQAAQQMLQAIQAKEKETQDKVNKEKAAALKSKQKEKNW